MLEVERSERLKTRAWSLYLDLRGLTRLVALLVLMPVAACSHSSAGTTTTSPAADLSQVPYFGEDRAALEARLGKYKIDYDQPDDPLAFYRFKVGDDLVRLSFIYALRKDGSDVLSGINIQHDNIEGGQADLSDEATKLNSASRLAVINSLLPDRSPVPMSSLSSSVRQDASPQGGNEDSAFFNSRMAARHVVQHPYWDIPQQRWISAAQCPASSPRTVQIYSSNSDGHVDEAGIYSEWLYDCMKREAFK